MLYIVIYCYILLYIGVLTNIFHLFPEQDQPSASRRPGRARGRGSRSPLPIRPASSSPDLDRPSTSGRQGRGRGSRSPLPSRPASSTPDQDRPARLHFRRPRRAPAVSHVTGKCNGFILFIFFKSNLLH